MATVTVKRLPIPLAVACIAALTFLHLAVNGYSFGGANGRPASPSSDHANIVPWVDFYQDSSLFPHDAAIQMDASYATVLWRGVALGSHLLPVEWGFFLLHLLTLAAMHATIFLLARRGCSSDAAGLLACLLFVVVRHGPAGVDTHDPALYTRTAALPAGLFALWLILSRRPLLAAAVLGAAYCIHPLTAFYLSAIAVPLWLLSTDLPWSHRIQPLVLLVVVVAASSWIVGGAGTAQLGPPSEAWLQLQMGNNSMHLFPWLWDEGVWRDFLLSVLSLMPPLLSPGERDDRRLALSTLLAASGLLALGWTTTAWLPSMLFMQLQPLRGLQMTIVIGLVLAARWLAAQIVGPEASTMPMPGLWGSREAGLAGGSRPVRPSVRHGEIPPAVHSAARSSRKGKTLRRTAAPAPASASGLPLDPMAPPSGPIPGQLSVLAAMLATLGLIAHQNVAALTGLSLLLLCAKGLRYRVPVVLAAFAILLVWLSKENAMRFIQTLPEALRPLGVTGAAGWCLFLILVPVLVTLLRASLRTHAAASGVVVVAALAFALSAFERDARVGWHYHPEADYPIRTQTNPWIEVQRWMATNIPRDALILNPPYLEGFRTFSRRSQFVDWKQGTLSMFHEPFGLEWLQRMQQIVQRPLDTRSAWRNVVLNYESLTPQALDGLFRQYGITHMITESSSKARPLPWREVYSNGAFRVLETGIPPPARRS